MNLSTKQIGGVLVVLLAAVTVGAVAFAPAMMNSPSSSGTNAANANASTPSEVPTTTETKQTSTPETVSSSALPTGLENTNNGSVKVLESKLAENHITILMNSSFRSSITETSDKENQTITGAVTSDETVFTFENTHTTMTKYQSGDGPIFMRIQNGGTPSYVTTEGIPRKKVFVQTAVVHGIVGGGDYTYVGKTTVNGETAYKLRLDGVGDTDQFKGSLRLSGTVKNASGTVVVTKEGTISSLDVTVTMVDSGTTAKHTYTYTTEVLSDDATVTPEWASTAEKKAVRMNVSAEKTHVKMAKTGGQTIPEGSYVFVTVDGEQHRATLPESVEDGETVYVAVADGSAKVGVGEKVSGDVAVTNFRGLTIVDRSDLLVIERFTN